ncbi:MAG: 2-hydroxyacyl-CoA dehydratase [Chloroflexi bacterium]|nr:2-hydroxyacyl-CoA dehydratase [Chloroflexota bacterium]
MPKTTKARYPTKPLEGWKHCKELRLQHYKAFITARDEGKAIFTGSGDGSQILVHALHDSLFLSGEPYGASIGGDPAASDAFSEACEARGFARDLDSYMRNYLGSMYLDRYYFGGPFPRPDFVFSFHVCDTHFKWYQIVAEHFNVPTFGIDIPVSGRLSDRRESRQEYLASQIYDGIEWLEKTTHRRFDDERFIQVLHNLTETESLWGQICIQNQAIPAPLDQRALFTLYFPGFMLFYQPETPAFYRELLDEVKQRVKDGIAAWPYERARILHDSQPPWHWMKVFRIMEQYGGVSVGSQYAFCGGCSFDVDDQGVWHAPKTIKERGIVLQSREDAVRFLAEWEVGRLMFSVFCGNADDKNRQFLQMVKQWHCDGVMFHLNRGCEGVAQLQLENRLAMIEAGIPVGSFEGNMADHREFDEAQTIDRIESFMESLGLTKLELA